jgi:uncharacterized repeat protein (TIGR03803 family)
MMGFVSRPLALAVLLGASCPAAAGSLTVLHAFSFPDEGEVPEGPLLMDAAGVLFGITGAGGSNFNGVLYSLQPDGTYTVLHNFGDAAGAFPSGRIAEDAAGNFYGTTQANPNLFGGSGYGVVYRWSPGDIVTALHTFDGDDGKQPVSGVVRQPGGSLAGTTSTGVGATIDGTAFRVSAGGAFSTVHRFGPVHNGRVPNGIAQDASGTIYVTTGSGGATGPKACPEGCGVVLRRAADGATTILHRLTPREGLGLSGGITVDGVGDVYVTTGAAVIAGKQTSAGAVLRIAPSGETTILHEFKDDGVDGAGPLGLALAPDGTLYGDTRGGGPQGFGTLWRITPSGRYAVLHDFDFTAEGGAPDGGLIVGVDGALYDATSEGGAGSDGTIIRYVP